jgi:hypothetical protein
VLLFAAVEQNAVMTKQKKAKSATTITRYWVMVALKTASLAEGATARREATLYSRSRSTDSKESGVGYFCSKYSPLSQ